MSDFAMCSNYKCNKRDRCLRYRAEPSPRQSYGTFQQENCDYMIDTMGWNNTPMVPTRDADERNKG